jgi:hypothetical protein
VMCVTAGINSSKQGADINDQQLPDQQPRQSSRIITPSEICVRERCRGNDAAQGEIDRPRWMPALGVSPFDAEKVLSGGLRAESV